MNETFVLLSCLCLQISLKWSSFSSSFFVSSLGEHTWIPYFSDLILLICYTHTINFIITLYNIISATTLKCFNWSLLQPGYLLQHIQNSNFSMLVFSKWLFFIYCRSCGLEAIAALYTQSTLFCSDFALHTLTEMKHPVFWLVSI